jgi:biopolymer transport protein ExbB/TolQ
MWPLLILALINLFLIIRGMLALFAGTPADPRKAVQGLHAILFWGVISALLGILGQLSGIYHAMLAIMQADALSPSVIAMGFAESMTTTIFGLTILFFSAVAWFALHARYRQVAGD